MAATRAPRTSARVAVVAAMRAEVAPLLARMQVAHRARVDGCRMVAGRLEGRAVVVAWTGEGATLAARGAAALLERYPASALMVVGVSGGLSPGLPAGTLLAARRLCMAAASGDGAAPAPDARWLDAALALPELRAADVVSSDRILASAASKTRAGAKLPGDAPAAVDLESLHYARVAAERGVPFVVLRAVCDPVEEELPLDLESCRDADGAVSRTRVLREALKQPSSVGALRALWGLQRRVRSCAEGLAGAVERLVREAGR
jgi:adenosylhomocysteine nucleosidase